MLHTLSKLFQDSAIVEKVQKRLPYFFQLAEVENSRDGKLGMEIGSARERILISLLMSVYGKESINVNIPITQNETDVILLDIPLSIKTITSRKIQGVKLIWTVDAQKSLEFIEKYSPECNILLAHIHWHHTGGLYSRIGNF